MGWVAPAISVGSALLGNKASKNQRNMANEAMRNQMTLAGQAMQPYDEFYNFKGGAPEEGMSPWELAIARNYTDALQGYDPNTSSLQQSALLEAIDRAYAANQAAQSERLTQAGFDPNSGTALRAAQEMDEARALGRQTTARDLYFQNEELKRQAASNLGNMGRSVADIPLAASGAYGQAGAAAQNRADQIMGSYSGLAGTLGTMYGMGAFGGGGAESPSTVSGGMSGIGGAMQGPRGTTRQTTMAPTSTMQPPNFGSSTSWINRYKMGNQDRYIERLNRF
jgi:hypothetical protein